MLQYAALLLRAALSRQLLRQNRAGRRPVAVVMMIIHLRTFTGISDTVRMLGWSVALTWGYRQLTLVWRIRSLFQVKLAGGGNAAGRILDRIRLGRHRKGVQVVARTGR